jgi:hypothetical protein
VKRLTPEGQPQLLDRGAALSSLVVRGGDVEIEVLRSGLCRSRAGASQWLIARCMLVRRSRASLCPGGLN